jgi:hypothetical protein
VIDAVAGMNLDAFYASYRSNSALLGSG